jgi:hypothetical protein
MRRVPKVGLHRSPETLAWAKHARTMATAEHLPSCTEDTREVYPCPGGQQGCNSAEARAEWGRQADEAEALLGLAPKPQEKDATWVDVPLF